MSNSAVFLAGVASIALSPEFRSDYPLADLKTSPQVRGDLGDLTELTNSIRKKGIIQAILIMEDGTIICGHRRAEAAKAAGLTVIPAMIYPMLDPVQVKLLQLTENLQREGMDERDIFKSCLQLEIEGMSRGDIAKAIGKSAGTVTKYLSPGSCPPEAKEHFLAGKLTLGQCYKISISPEPLATMRLFLDGETHEKASRKAKQPSVAAVRVEKIKCPLASGPVVTVAGEAVSLEDAIEALIEAQKALKWALGKGYTAKTAQAALKDMAAAG